MTPVRKVAFRTLLGSLIAIALFVCVAEVALRLSSDSSKSTIAWRNAWEVGTDCWDYGPRTNPSTGLIQRGDAVFTMSVSPHGYRVNAAPPNMNVIDPNDPKHEIRIAIMGSSFPLGWLVDDEHTLSAQLERLLDQSGAFNRPVRVLNFASASRTGFQHLRGYLCDVSRYQPDAIVVVSPPPPLPAENYSRLSVDEIIEASQSVEKARELWPTPYFLEDGFLQYNRGESALGRFLYYHSRLVRYVWRRIDKSGQQNFFETIMSQIANQGPQNISPFVALNQQLRKKDITYIHLLRAGFDKSTFEKFEVDRDEICKMIENNLRGAGIIPIDGCNLLEGIDPAIAFTSDSHWSSSSNLLFAKAIAEKLLQNKDKISADRTE